MLKSILALVGISLATHSAFAVMPVVCTTQASPSGAFMSIVLTPKGSEVLISGHASGGIAHFVTGFGPFVAARSGSGDMAVYTFTDNMGQHGAVRLVATNINGHLVTTATSNFGMWSDAPMFCK